MKHMKTSFLDYYKIVLQKVSFDGKLFTKEYMKAVESLQPNEISDLNHWMKTKGLAHNLEYIPANQKNREYFSGTAR